MRCSVKLCRESNDLEGANVQIEYSTDRSWYIVPLCGDHNKSEGSLIVDDIPFISANKGETCEKN